MKLRLALFAGLFLPVMAWAQTVTPIQQIQGWAGQFQPDSCNDGPNPAFLTAPVKVRGVVITRGGLNVTTGQTRWIWIRDVSATSPSTPYANVSIRAGAATTPTDINTLIEGDTIEVVGSVVEFNGTNAGNGETQITPTSVQLISEEAGPAPLAALVNVGELNGVLNATDQPTNHLTTGEKYEGNFVEIQNVQVVRVDLSTADRVRILVKDASNNHIWIYDRFTPQRISSGFIAPNVGDVYTSVKGMIEGWKNGCAQNNAASRGYNLNPFSLAHYVKGASSPAIGLTKKSTPCPSSTTPVTISVNVTDDESVSKVEVLYSISGRGAYTVLPTTVIGTRYSATIPALPNDTMVRYFIRATDNLNNTTVQPNVPANIAPLFYNVNNAGCTIKDIQFTVNTNGRSGYVGDTLTLNGIVTASAESNNLGYVCIQQPGELEWSGIWLNGGSLITDLKIGDLVNITGSIEESNFLTRLTNISNVSVVLSNQPVPEPILISPAALTTYSAATNEKYESMLVKLNAPNLFVVDTNADASRLANNGEYRIGADVNDPNTGCRILAGRQASNSFSSLNVSAVNSTRWATQDGTMKVPLVLVQPNSPVTLAQGILTFSFSNMKLLPRNNADLVVTVDNKPLLNENQFLVYPNPASEKIHLRFEKAVSTSLAQIFNNQGQLVSQREVSGLSAEMDVKKLATGLYRLKVKDAKGNIIAVRNLAIGK